MWYVKQLEYEFANNYALIKTNKLKYMVFFPPTIKSGPKLLKERLSLRKVFFRKISFFISINKEFSPSFDLNNFYQNINTARFITFSDEDAKKNGSFGLYYNGDNIIKTIQSEDHSTIYHELYHLSSSYIAKDGTVFTGFSQAPNLKTPQIARGINEGYTALITNRNFGNDYSFPVERYFMGMIEDIIGREMLEGLYSKMNLLGLIEEVNIKGIGEEFINCLFALDNIQINNPYLITNLQTAYLNIALILVNLMKEKINYGLIGPQMAELSINNQMSILNNIIYNSYTPSISNAVLSNQFLTKVKNQIWSNIYFIKVQ
ncbi:MAG: hypothetical protein GX864_01910 [Mollicutes bacterium]|nr:hypothetical protein [Mollicutes bacterium]